MNWERSRKRTKRERTETRTAFATWSWDGKQTCVLVGEDIMTAISIHSALRWSRRWVIREMSVECAILKRVLTSEPNNPQEELHEQVSGSQ